MSAVLRPSVSPPSPAPPHERQAARWYALTLAAAVALFSAVAFDVTHGGALARLDVRVARWVADDMPGWAEWLARPPTWAGGAVGMALVAVAGSYWLVRRGRRFDGGLIFVAYAVAQLLTLALKHAFHRARPAAGSAIPLPHSFSFPSGHASTAVAVLGLLAVLLAYPPSSRRRLVAQSHKAWILAGAAVLSGVVGASRVVLDVHYVSDVLAGFCVGLATLVACLLVADLSRLARRPARRTTAASAAGPGKRGRAPTAPG